MDKTYCLFSSSPDGFCSGPRHSNVNHLICANHLRQYYGLEVGTFYVEKRTETFYGGWFLRPAPGTHFKKNDIIIPVRNIVDIIFRAQKKDANMKIDGYSMNPILKKYMEAITNSGNRISPQERRMFEMLRNLSEPLEKIGLNHIEGCETEASAIAYIKSKMTMSQTYIEEYSGYKLDGFTVFTDKEEKLMNHAELSHNFQYFLSRLEYCAHLAEDSSATVKETHRMNYNAIYVNGVGLVATRDISNPNTIVMLGSCRGRIEDDDGYYKTHVISVPKEIVQPRVGAGMIPQQNAMKRAFVTGFKG